MDSVTLGDSDAIARAVLALPPVASLPAGIRAVADQTADDTLPGVIV